VKPDPAGDTEVLGARGFAQPDGAVEQHVLGVILHTPGQIFPMAHERAAVPVAVNLGKPGLVELSRPLRHVQVTLLELYQGLSMTGPAGGSQAHPLPPLVPVTEDVARDPAVEGPKARNKIELIPQEPAPRFEPYLSQRLQVGTAEPIVALR